MLGREPYETEFQGGTEIRGFNQIEKFLRHITPQNKLYCFSEKKILGLGAQRDNVPRLIGTILLRVSQTGRLKLQLLTVFDLHRKKW